MATKAQLLLPSVRLPATQDLSSLMASTNQVLLSMNTQMQQISSAFTLTKPTTTVDGSFGGVTVGNINMGSTNYIKGGALGYNSGTGFWMGYDTGALAGYKFFIGSSIGNKLTWNGSSLSITGSITATSGTIGGWDIGSTTISALSNKIVLDASQGSVRAGQTAYATGTGFWLGNTAGTPKLSIGSTTNYVRWDGSNMLLLGGASPNNVIIDSNGFAVGTASGKRVAVGTFSGNSASLNFFTGTNVARMGLYLDSGVDPYIKILNNGGSNITQADMYFPQGNYLFRISSTSLIYGTSDFQVDSSTGTTIMLLSGPSGSGGSGPYLTLTDTTASTTVNIFSSNLTVNDTNYTLQLTSKAIKWTKVAGSVNVSKIEPIGINNIAITGRVDFLNDVSFGVYNAGASAITGYIYIYDNAGNARKLAVIA